MARWHRPLLKVGDIVTTTKRSGGQLFKVTAVEDKVWTAQQAQYGHCDASDVGNSYTDVCEMEAVFYFTMPPKLKNRKKTDRAYTWYIKKIEPQHVQELIQKLNNFLVDAWP